MGTNFHPYFLNLSLVGIIKRGVLKKKSVDPYDFGPGQFWAIFGFYGPQIEIFFAISTP